MRIWHRYVAIGDSFSEGMSDPDPDRPGAFRGWTDRLAAHLAADTLAARDHTADGGFGYANLAIRGRLLDDVVTNQLPAALALNPDLVSIVGGGNDILRPKADIDAMADKLERAVAAIRAAGSDVLMATPTDPRGAPLVKHTRGRVGIFIAHQRAIAHRYDAFLLDQWSLTALQDWRMWVEDRIHLTSEGHRRVAREAYATLQGHPREDSWAAPLPPLAATPRREQLDADLTWAREYLKPWVGRRLRGQSSGDRLAPKRAQLAPIDPDPVAVSSDQY